MVHLELLAKSKKKGLDEHDQFVEIKGKQHDGGRVHQLEYNPVFLMVESPPI